MAFTRGVCPLILASLLCLLCFAPSGLAREDDEEPAQGPELLVQLGHAGDVRAAAFSQDGRLIATAGFDNFVRLWDRATGQEIRRFQESELGVNALAFSPDGRTILTGGGNWDGQQRLWISSGSHLRQTMGGDRPFRETDNSVRLWDVRTGHEVRQLLGHRTMVTAVAFSPDGARLLTGSADGMVRLWSAAGGETIRRLDKTHRAMVKAVAFSPDGETFLTAGGEGRIRLWNAADRKEIRTWTDAPSLRSATFSPDGRLVVTRSGGGDEMLVQRAQRERACAWSTATGEQVRCVEGAVLAPDGLSALFVEPAGFFELRSGRGEDRARRLDLSSGTERRLRLEEMIGSSFLAFSPEGRQVLIRHSEGARLFDVQGDDPPVPLERLAIPPWSVAVSPGGRRIAVGGGDGVIHLWRTDTGKEEEKTLSRIESDRPGAIGVDAIAFPEGDQLLLTLGQGIARLWNLHSGEQVRAYDLGKFSETFLAGDGRTLFQDVQGSIMLRDGVSGAEIGRVAPLEDSSILALSREARLGVSEGENGVVCRELARGRELWRHPLESTLGAFSLGDRTVALGSIDGEVVVVEASTGKERWRAKGHPMPVTSLAFSADGTRLATSDGGGLTVLWNAESGQRLHALASHQVGINHLAFSPDDRFLATASNDATTRLWHSQTGEEICRLVSFKDDAWAVMAPDGRFDTNRLDEIPGLYWIMPDDPLTPLPPEIFLRDFYEPGLLPRLLDGDSFRPVQPLVNLNRALPEVRISRVTARPGVPDEAVVEIEMASTAREIERGGKTIRMESGVRDLHVLRDGRLVDVEESISLDAEGQARRTFHVRLPRRAEPREVMFSAYAFNTDRVKSATHAVSFPLPRDVQTVAGRAFVIAIGVADDENPGWKLSYPANDTRRMLRAAGETLRRSGRYREVVEVPLISGRNPADRLPAEVAPTKANLRTVFQLLAGHAPDPERLAALPEDLRSRIVEARPDDLVLLSFSGHGATDASGIFRLYPYDLGGASEVPPERTLSSEVLALWLRGIDAGEMALVLDACRSGAAAGPDFKPAPLGDRGLGQLAYDKRMPILAATQGDEDAVGSGALRHGLLTFALTKEGLEDGRALRDGAFHLDAWLVWGRDRVPGLYAEKVASDRSSGPRRPGVRSLRPSS